MRTALAALCPAIALLVSACAAPPVDHRHQTAEQRYRCESGEVIAVSYAGQDAARVRYQDRAYRMGIAISGSGARYTGEGLEWWTRGSGPGSTGRLSRLKPDGSPGGTIEDCSGE